MDTHIQIASRAGILSPAQRLNRDSLIAIFSHAVYVDLPSLCSCMRHGRYGTITCTYNLGWIKVSHICRTWRNVSLEMRALWADNVCALNNSAMVEFIRRAEDQPLVLDLNSPGNRRFMEPDVLERRSVLINDNIERARIISSSRGGELEMLDGQLLPVLEVLELVSYKDMTIDAPNLREATLNGMGHITLLAPNILRARCLSPTTFTQSPSLQILEFRWPSHLCAQIPLMLTTLPILRKLTIEVYEDERAKFLLALDSEEDIEEDIDTELVVHDPDEDILKLRSRGASLSLPHLRELRVSGQGVVRRPMCGLLAHLTTTSMESLRRIEVHCDDLNFTNSTLAFKAIRTFTHVIYADAVYLHFKDVTNSVRAALSVVISASRLASRNDPDCPFGTFGFFIPVDPDKIDLILKRLMPLLPLRRIAHLFIESLPLRGTPSLPAQAALAAALSKLTTVYTLHVRDNDRYSSDDESPEGLYPLLGPLEKPNLRSLERLVISYSRGMFRDWWKRLAIALAARKRAGMPFTSLCITHEWGLNVQRREGTAVSLLETFHEQSGVDLQAPDVFVANAPVQAFSLDGASVWAKEKVESVARSLFAQVVETIEVVEAPRLEPVWPPNL